MAAYIIATYDIIDTKGYEGYVPGVLPLLMKHGAQVVVADYQGQALEGRAPGVTVVLKFDTEKQALDWYNDPAYGPVKKIRIDASANTTIVLAKEFQMPSA